MKHLKVAIYSGVIPTTTFIENLIVAVAAENVDVYLFGSLVKPTAYKNSNIHIFESQEAKWKIIPYVIYVKILLLLKNYSNYLKLNSHINSISDSRRQKWNYWMKYLPIVYNLPDVFHVQWGKKCDEWMFLKEKFGVKIVLSLRGAHINYSPLANPELASMYRRVFPEIDAFHAVSNAIGIEATKYSANPEKIKTIYTAINISNDSISKIQHSEKSNNKKLNFISAGRFHWKKGYNIAIDALKKLKDSGIDFHYTIVAAGNPEQVLYQIQELEMQNEIKVLSKMSQEQLINLYQSSDLFILPSFEEGIANVVLEAMAVGLPVVSSDCDGMSEAINHGKSGYLFRNHDCNDLFDQIMSFVNDSDKKKEEMIRNARDYVIKNHTSKNLGIQMKSLYDQITTNK